MPSGNPLLFQARVVLLEDLQSYILYIYTYLNVSFWSMVILIYINMSRMYSYAEIFLIYIKYQTLNLSEYIYIYEEKLVTVRRWCSKCGVLKVIHAFRKPPVVYKPGSFLWGNCDLIHIYHIYIVMEQGDFWSCHKYI